MTAGKAWRGWAALLAALALTVSAVVSVAQGAAADESYSPHGTWNGNRIYLSPARHSPDNVGCGGYSENTGNWLAARAVTSSTYRDGTYYPDWHDQGSLRTRGYQVRIGTGTINTAIANSNAWNATLHVPMHTNTKSGNTCSSTAPSNGGTWVMYRSTGGYNLSTDILGFLDFKSPGSNDRVCTDQVCAGYDLGELKYTNAVASYVESEFHTWDTGRAWIATANTQWGHRVAAGIDRHLGYPR